MSADFGPDYQLLGGWHSSETRRRGGLGIWRLDRQSEGVSLEKHLAVFFEHPVEGWHSGQQPGDLRGAFCTEPDFGLQRVQSRPPEGVVIDQRQGCMGSPPELPRGRAHTLMPAHHSTAQHSTVQWLDGHRSTA